MMNWMNVLKICFVSLLTTLSLLAETVEIQFNDDATLLGVIKIKEATDSKGNKVPTYFFQTDDQVKITPSEAEDPGNTNEVLDGMEIRLVSGENELLDKYIGQNVMVIAKVTGGSDLHLYNFGLYLESLETVIPR